MNQFRLFPLWLSSRNQDFPAALKAGSSLSTVFKNPSGNDLLLGLTRVLFIAIQCNRQSDQASVHRVDTPELTPMCDYNIISSRITS